MSKDDIIRILNETKDQIKNQHKANIIGIFGSFARGEETKKSDVDILVEFMPGATLLDLVAASNFLEKKLHKKVDLVSKRALKDEIKSYVMRDFIDI
jgi:predicted nucleotidyltransferase